MRRRNHGQPLRDAMREAGLSGPRLAAATREIDPDGGISPALVGFVAGSGASSREECSDRVAHLIAQALQRPVDELFEEDGIPMLANSTSTTGTETDDVRTVPHTEVMLTVAELAGHIKKSKSWIWSKIRDRRTNQFPTHYAGNSPRFFASEVHSWMRSEAIRSGRIAA